MIINPILPIWMMIIICIGILLLRPKDKFKFFRQIIIVILLFIINLRIMIPGETQTYEADNNIDVLFVIDNSISMVAEDYSGNRPRLNAVKKDCEKIINSLSGARFSVISFADQAKILVPYTKDENVTIDAINAINIPELLNGRGSSINAPIEIMLEDLKRADESRNKIVFFISDGEITKEGEKLASYSEISKYVDDGAVLGYGTTSGGKMRVKNSYYDNTTEIVVDRTNWPYKDALSIIDENNLKKIASDLKIDYIKMDKQTNIDSKLKDIIKKYEHTSYGDEENKTSFTDTYFVFSEIICFILVIEYINYKRRV